MTLVVSRRAIFLDRIIPAGETPALRFDSRRDIFLVRFIPKVYIIGGQLKDRSESHG
jgi:hypothetical protein